MSLTAIFQWEKWQYVDVGEENEEYLQFKSGVAIWDTVIVAGHYTQAHNAMVSITRRKNG
jgi:hypothetical protein